MNCEGVLFDFIGTTVMESKPDIITGCFEKTLRENKIPNDLTLVQDNRGRNKQEIINLILQKNNLPPALGPQLLQAFYSNITSNLHHFTAQAGAAELFEQLKNQNIKIGLGSGLSEDIVFKIMEQLNWDTHIVDYIGTADTVQRGRPYADMVRDFMKRTGITNHLHVLKIGDTIADIQEGKNAGVITIAILSGTQPTEKLLQEKPDHVIHHLNEVIEILEKRINEPA